MIGTTTTDAGSGSGPIKIAGKAFLAGPYKGAPLSMAVITPASRARMTRHRRRQGALNVNPETAQVNAVSDPIPNVFGGVKLDIRSIDVNVDRSQFMLNPTNCAAQATSGPSMGAARPGRPGRVQLLRGQRSVPGDRLQQAWLQAEAAHAALRPDQAGEEPAASGRSWKHAKAMPTSAARR